MDVTISKTADSKVLHKAINYLDNKFPTYKKSIEAENGGDAYVVVYKKDNKIIRLVNDTFVDANWIESNFDFEVPKFEE